MTSEYFQRFEPLTAGDALKRVPSVTFLSDVIESDGARLRGLDPGYTQILINGEKVPGTNADRSFFLDRIPAELIEQVEIVRSSSARRTGDAVAGTLNIVLRDALRRSTAAMSAAAALLFDDGEVKPTARRVLRRRSSGRAAPDRRATSRAATTPSTRPACASAIRPRTIRISRPTTSTTAKTRPIPATAPTTRQRQLWVRRRRPPISSSAAIMSAPTAPRPSAASNMTIRPRSPARSRDGAGNLLTDDSQHQRDRSGKLQRSRPSSRTSGRSARRRSRRASRASTTGRSDRVRDRFRHDEDPPDVSRRR